jgi:hypothetical protein
VREQRLEIRFTGELIAAHTDEHGDEYTLYRTPYGYKVYIDNGDEAWLEAGAGLNEKTIRWLSPGLASAAGLD